LKIVFIYQYFGTPKGSWSTRVYELTRRWVSEGHEITVITAPYGKSDIKARGLVSKQQVDGVNLIIINSGDNNRLNFFYRSFKSFIFSMISIFYVFRLKYDIIISSSGPITVGLPMIIAKVFLKKKTVFEVRDIWPDGAIELGKIKSKILIRYLLKFEKICYQKADLIVAASVGMKNNINNKIKTKKIIVIPNASDIQLFSINKSYPINYPSKISNHKVILYAGSLGLMDECKTAILAMEGFEKENLSLVFLGDGSERMELEHLAKQVNNPNIYFYGLIPKTEVVKWYSIASVSLVGFKNLPILSTSSPNKMFDSFAAGVPIIQNTEGWIKDLINDYNCGYNVAYQNVEAYKKIYRHLLDFDLKDKSFNAKKVAADLFDRDELSTNYLSNLSKLI